MKLLSASFVALIALYLTGCDRAESNVYAKLKSETGATDEELEEGVKFYTKFYVLVRDEIEAGTVNVEDMVAAAKDAKKVMATMQREDEMAAVMTLAHLRTLESEGSEKAREAMVRQLRRFVEAEFPSTESSKMIREKIEEYAVSSDAFNAPKQQSNKANNQ